MTRAFFERDTCTVAQDLIGRLLVHEIDGARLAGRIVETEAYTGFEDSASHGSSGQTGRNWPMFGPVGVSYVYLCYGMYWLFNLVAKPAGVDYPAAILIRALEPVEGLQHMATRRNGRPRHEWTSGPGRLVLAMGISPEMNAISLVEPESNLYLEAGTPASAAELASGPRIGISAPEPWKSIHRRYWIAGNHFVSRGQPPGTHRG